MNNERMYYSHDAAQRAKRERLMMAIVVAGLSASVGAIVALLLAPQSGDEIRQQVAEQVDHATKNMRDNVTKMRDEMEKQLQTATK